MMKQYHIMAVFAVQHKRFFIGLFFIVLARLLFAEPEPLYTPAIHGLNSAGRLVEKTLKIMDRIGYDLAFDTSISYESVEYKENTSKPANTELIYDVSGRIRMTEHIAFAENLLVSLKTNPNTGSTNDILPFLGGATDFIVNGGLILSSRFGSVGGFIGYYDYFVGGQVGSDSGLGFWIVPKLDTKTYPLIGVVLRAIQGYVNIEESSLKSTSVALVTNEFDAGFVHISFMDYFYKKEPYNIETSNEIYGIRIGAEHFVLEGGYTRFFDRKAHESYYKDGFFGKLTVFTALGGFDAGLSAHSSARYAPVPKFGIMARFKRFSLGSDFYMSSDILEWSIGLNYWL